MRFLLNGILRKANAICSDKADHRCLRRGWGMRKMFYYLDFGGVMKVGVFVKTHQTLHLKYCKCILLYIKCNPIKPSFIYFLK